MNDDIRAIIAAWQTRYGLTNAETDILSHAVEKDTSRRAISVERGTNQNTVKKQIRTLLLKTDHFTLAQAALAVLREYVAHALERPEETRSEASPARS